MSQSPFTAPIDRLPPERAEAVASRAVAVGALTTKSIASIIAAKLDRAPAAEPSAVIAHANLRGSDYFH